MYMLVCVYMICQYTSMILLELAISSKLVDCGEGRFGKVFLMITGDCACINHPYAAKVEFTV